MGLFGRRKKEAKTDVAAGRGGDEDVAGDAPATTPNAGAHAQAGGPADSSPSAQPAAVGSQPAAAADAADAEDPEAPASPEAVEVPLGPWDISAPLVTDIPRVSLGTLYLPVVAGMQLTTPQPVEGAIPLVEVGVADTVMQLALMATARSGGLWDELLPQLATQLEASGYRVEHVETVNGKALLGKPTQPGEGHMDLLLEGFQGNGWLLRAIFRGAAATDPDKRAPLLQLVHHAIVDRGDGFYAPGDIIPMSEPKGPQTAAQDESATVTPTGSRADEGETPGSAPQAPGAQV